MSRLGARLAIIQAQQQVYEQMRWEFQGLGSSSRYSDQQKRYALRLIDDLGVRATARVLQIPRMTLQRWCRAEGWYVKRCPDWVYEWAAKRRRRRGFRKPLRVGDVAT